MAIDLIRQIRYEYLLKKLEAKKKNCMRQAYNNAMLSKRIEEAVQQQAEQ